MIAMRFTFPILLVLSTLCLRTVPCESAERVWGTLGDAFVAEHVGLRREWIVQVPFDSRATRLTHVTVVDGLVLASAGDGSLHGIAASVENAEADLPTGLPAVGSVLWTHHRDARTKSYFPPTAGSGIVVIAGDFVVTGIDAQSGHTLWKYPLPSPAIATPAISGNWVYVPIERGRLLRLPVNPLRKTSGLENTLITSGQDKTTDQNTELKAVSFNDGDDDRSPWQISTHNALALPPLPIEKGVLWCTTAGTISRFIEATPDWIRLGFQLGRPPIGQLLLSNDSIFTSINSGSSASDVVRIDLLPTGNVFVWREPLTDSVTGAIWQLDNTIFVPLATGGLTALAAEDGRWLWTHSKKVQLLTIAANKLWCLDDMERLAALDPSDGSRLQQFCLDPFRLSVTNRQTDRLILASPGGIITSLVSRSEHVNNEATDSPEKNVQNPQKNEP